MAIINQIVGGSAKKHGIGINSVIGDVVGGELKTPSSAESIVLSGITSIGQNALMSRFIGNRNLLSFSASGVTAITGSWACAYMLVSCSNLQTLNFGDLVTIADTIGATVSPFYYMCLSCSQLLTADMHSLESIGTYGFSSTFEGAGAFQSLSLPALTTLKDYSLYRAFCSTAIQQLTLGGTSAITITGNPFSGMFAGCVNNITVNAPAANQTQIEALSGYPNFGGAGTVTWNWVS